MLLKSLLFCPDQKTAGVLVRALADLEISVEPLDDANDAVKRLRVERYDAIIVDCDEKERAGLLLNTAREAPCNKHSLVAAIIDSKTSAKSAFGIGASFVLYKPISMERAKNSLRAARGLMKRQRRRILRIPVQGLSLINSKHEQITVTGDVSWQDRNGRFGIRFLDTPQTSRRALREWVLLNAHKKLEANPYTLGRAALPEG